MFASTWINAAIGFTAATAVLAALPAEATCPEGESEITIVTPSGKEKLLCIPDQAVAGLENAADHSQGTVIPAVCPCFTAADVEAALASDPEMICAVQIGVADVSGALCTRVSCFNGVIFDAFEGPSAKVEGGCVFEGPPRFKLTENNQCFSDATGDLSPITETEGDACVATLESFIEEP
jgi:hypothetical protein